MPPITDELRDPFRRKLLQTTATNAAQAGQPSTLVPGEADIPVSPELDITKITQSIRDESQAIRDQGYQEVAAHAKQRGILDSGITARLDQRVAENARLMAEGRLADATLQLMTLRQNERLAKFGAISQAAGQEVAGRQQIGAIQETGTQTRQTIGAESAASIAQIRATGEEQRATQSPALAVQAQIARENNTTQKAVADIQAAISAGDNVSAERIATANNLTATQLENIRTRSSELIAGSQQTTAALGYASQERMQAEQLRFQREGLSEQAAARVAQNKIDIGNLLGEVRSPERGYIEDTLARKAHDQSVIQFNATLSTQVGEGKLTRDSAEKIAQWNNNAQLSVAREGYTNQQTLADKTLSFQREGLSEQSSARAAQNYIDLAQLVGTVKDPNTNILVNTLAKAAQTESIQQFNATLNNQSLDRNLTMNIAKWNVINQASGFDITTDTGRREFNSWAKSNQLTAQDQKDVIKSQLSVQASGYDVTTDVGRKEFQFFVKAQADKFSLTAADQKSLEVARISQGAAGSDLTTEQGRANYYNYLKTQADIFNLTAQDQKNIASNQLHEQGRQFDLTQAQEWDKFLVATEQTAQQFNISQEDQLAIVRAQLESNTSIANANINVKMLEDSIDLLGNAVASAGFMDSELKTLIDRFMEIQIKVDPITGVKVPTSAAVIANGSSPSLRAKAAAGNALQDVNVSRKVTEDFTAAFNSIRGQRGYNSKFDFDQNGVVNLDDYFVLSGYLNNG